MAAITSLGIGSGLDINSMVTQLVALESRPLTQMKAEATSLQTQVSSYGKLSSLFSALQSASAKLNGTSLWAQATASSSDSAAVSVSGGAGATTGNYAVSVQQLAGSQTLAQGTAVPDASSLVGAGQFTVQLGAWEDNPPLTFVPKVGGGSATIDVTASDTLQTLRDKINALGAGVTASLVTDSSGVRLAMRSSATGAENGFRITTTDVDGNITDDAGLSRFAYDPEGGASGMALKQAAQNALASVNGIAVESASNELSTVIAGVTLSLRKETTSDVDVAVSVDRAGIKSAIEAFASAYNDIAKTIAEQTKYDATSKVGGPLQGDSAVGSLQRQLRAVINSASTASAAFPRLSDVGLEIQRDGTLKVDTTKLDTAANNLSELKKAFGNSDPGNVSNQGFARRYADLATQVLGVDGSLTTRTEGLRQRLTRNSTDQERLADRVDRYQQRLVAQYTAMDANLSKLNSLSNYLTQQLASLTSSSSNNS
jgi:flagellar hook-associated protein 2